MKPFILLVLLVAGVLRTLAEKPLGLTLLSIPSNGMIRPGEEGKLLVTLKNLGVAITSMEVDLPKGIIFKNSDGHPEITKKPDGSSIVYWSTSPITPALGESLTTVIDLLATMNASTTSTIVTKLYSGASLRGRRLHTSASIDVSFSVDRNKCTIISWVTHGISFDYETAKSR